MKNIYLLLVVALFAVSCASTKQVTYFQDLPDQKDTTIQFVKGDFIRAQPGDAMSIVVHTQDAELNAQFNLPIISNSLDNGTVMGGSNATSRGISRYTVSPIGTIDFPVLGELQVGGLTRREIQVLVRTKLMEEKLVKDPIVSVEFSNMYISVMGSVRSPGRYQIDRDQITILDAISKAGDLDIVGKRQDVLVIRTDDETNTQKAYRVNLCKATQLYSSPVYYIQQNDIIYVAPNKKQVRNSTVNGNNVLSASFWLTLTSTLVSVISVAVALSK